MKQFAIGVLVVVLSVVTVGVIAFFMLDVELDAILDTGTKSFEATYRLTSDNRFATADITLENAGGNTEQRSEVDLPYELSFPAVEGQFLYISGQINRDASITCELLIDGVVQETATSEGEFVIATCSGRYQLP